MISINGKDLSIAELVKVATEREKIEIDPNVQAKIDRIWKYVEKAVDLAIHLAMHPTQENLKKQMIYGVTTGFGVLKNVYCKSEEDARQLQKNIIASHASGVGDHLDEKATRAIMVLRANALASGYCGVRYDLLRRLVQLINSDVLPLIPEQGSVGASGDLAPLAHLALGVTGNGPVQYHGEIFENLGILLAKYPDSFSGNACFDVSYKEGLALLNGTSVMTGIGVLAFWDAWNLLEWADTIGAMTLESILGSSRAFDPIVFSIYHHDGAKVSAQAVLKMTKSSKLLNNSEHVHDPYCVRCIPQVHGAVRDVLNFVRTTLEKHINSVTDDPIFFDEDEMNTYPAPVDGWNTRRHFEHGHFHGEPIAFAMDMLAMVLSEIGSISERRTQMLLDQNHNRGLPACLIDNPKGINSGYMIAQYTAAALVSENKILAHPASVDSIPTSANAEDHVSMGTIAARKAKKVVEHVENILAIELLCATQAISHRLTRDHRQPGDGTIQIYNLVRREIPFLTEDGIALYQLIEKAKKIVLHACPNWAV